MRCALLAAMLLLACAGCSDTSTVSSPGATSTPSPQPTATPTAIPGTVSGGMLGGTETDFIAHFGPSSNSAALSRIYQTNIAGQSVRMDIRLIDGAGGKRVRFIHIIPQDSSVTWDIATANGLAKTLFPPDAVFKRDATVADFGTEHIYLSKQLAKSFDASLFVGPASNVIAGTFYYACGDADETQGGCTLQLGEL